ncbi:MAG: hypothetical protein IKL53_01630 [Lachnospiraceae bacterium]|nr:hypothetical protein [Lachnospiraceae bacterium]
MSYAYVSQRNNTYGIFSECVLMEAEIQTFQERSIMSPLRSLVSLVENIKKETPKEFKGDSNVKKYVDKYGDDIIKLAKALEDEKQKNWDKDMMKWFITNLAPLIIGYVTMAVGLNGIAILSFLISILISVLWMISQEMRRSDNATINNSLKKIKTSLSSINDKDMTPAVKKKVDNCIAAIDKALNNKKVKEEK